MWLYERKLICLEEEFSTTRDNLKKLLDQITNNAELDKSVIKLQLDLAAALIKLAKEQIAFYMKLSKKYDAFVLLEELTDEFIKVDPEKCQKFLNSINSRWNQASTRL